MRCQAWLCTADAIEPVRAGKRRHVVCAEDYAKAQRGEAITLRRDAEFVVGYAAGEVTPL